MRQIFAEQLGVGPSAEAMGLNETLSRGPAVHAPVGGPSVLAGRDVELARARALVRKVREGVGHTLLVRGDAGMGKTTFCEHLFVDAAAEGATTFRGAAQLDGPGAFAPVMDAVDRLLFARPDLAMALPEGSRKVLARLTTAAPFEPGDEVRAINRQRALSEIDLSPLSRDEIALLVRRISPTAPSVATIDAVHGRAAGNPLFSELLAGAVAPERDLPPDLDAVLSGVILRAGEPSVNLLGRLAVLGTQFTMQERLGLSGTSEQESFALLDEALEARLVEEHRGSYRFHHTLYADALLRRLPAHRLRQAGLDEARAAFAGGRGDAEARRTFLTQAKKRYLELGYHGHAARCG